MRTVWSLLAETMRCPSGLNAALVTVSVWPVIGSPIGTPVSESHCRTVLSWPPETMRRPSGLNRGDHISDMADDDQRAGYEAALVIQPV
jgi:hypothetical protein